MNRLLIPFFLLVSCSLFGQKNKSERVPSYFGVQLRPFFPTNFIGSSQLSLNQDGFFSLTQQRMGFSWGATVRAGITKLIAIETGINQTTRHFDIDMSVPDSNSFASDQLTFVEYDLPVNALFYIQLADKWYMNTSLGASMIFKPTEVGIFNQPGGKHYYTHTGVPKSKFGIDANANVGFEFRTEKSGFFYLGASAKVPFTSLFEMIANYEYDAYQTLLIGPVDGSFLAIDIKYFFPNIKNKGPQFQDGPIQ